MAVYMNAALTAHDLARELDATDIDSKEVVYGVYDLTTQLVESAPRHPETFAPAPKDAAEFSSLADLLVESIMSCGILAKPGE